MLFLTIPDHLEGKVRTRVVLMTIVVIMQDMDRSFPPVQVYGHVAHLRVAFVLLHIRRLPASKGLKPTKAQLVVVMRVPQELILEVSANFVAAKDLQPLTFTRIDSYLFALVFDRPRHSPHEIAVEIRTVAEPRASG